MTAKRLFLEIGTGNDLHGGDYTKAAVRAVQDAMHHSSLGLFRSLGIDPNSMQVDVTIGVQRPEKVDPGPVAAAQTAQQTQQPNQRQEKKGFFHRLWGVFK